jgi:hypothetical protein
MSIILIIYAIMTGLISAFELECVYRVANTQFSSFCNTIIALTVTCNKPSCSQKGIKKKQIWSRTLDNKIIFIFCHMS